MAKRSRTNTSSRKAKKKLPGWMPDLPARPSGGAGSSNKAKSGGHHAPRQAAPPAGAKSRGGAQRPRPTGAKSAHAGERKGRLHADPHAEREAQRYERPIPSREAILAFLAEGGSLLKADALAEGLGLHDPRDVEALDKRLSAMVRDGQLLQNRRGGYGVAQKLDLIPGNDHRQRRGLRFPAPGYRRRRYIHFPGRDAQGAARRPRAGSAWSAWTGAGASRARSSRCSSGARRGWSAGSSSTTASCWSCRTIAALHQDVLIPPGKDSGASSGQIVVAEITQPPNAQRGPIGEIVAVLGERLTPSLVVEMAIASHGLPQRMAGADAARGRAGRAAK